MIDALFRAYPQLPDRFINRLAGRVARLDRPRWLIRAAVRTWVACAGLDLTDYESTEHLSIQSFFLRRLRPGVRPLGPGICSPVDGVVVGAGQVVPRSRLMVKGENLELAESLAVSSAEVARNLSGGQFASIYLTPNGYHWVHAPADLVIRRLTWIRGRFWPQNARARRWLGDVCAVNERLSLMFEAQDGWRGYLTMVGASLVGGIHLVGVDEAVWQQPIPVAVDIPVSKGEPLGYFSFGSTVVLAIPAAAGSNWTIRPGERVRMGQSLAGPVQSTDSMRPNATARDTVLIPKPADIVVPHYTKSLADR